MSKKSHIALILSLAILSSCAKVEMTPAGQKAVVFSVGSYVPQTKASSLLNSDDNITSFSSRGFLHAEGVQDPQDFFGPDGETIRWNASNTEWVPSHDYFWPKSDISYVNFVSWRGGNPSLTYTKTDDKWGANLSWSNITVATTDNILWADVAWRYNDNAKTYLFDGVKEGVPTLFHHSLSQLSFQARLSKASEGGVSWTVTVTGMRVTNIRNTGSLSMTNTDPEARQVQPWTFTGWAELSGNQTLEPASPLSVSLETDTAKEMLGWQTVLPQTVLDNMTLTVNFNVTTTYNLGGGNTKTITEAASASCSLTKFTEITQWQMNKRYIYTVAINPDSKIITIIPVETDWTIEPEYTLTIE